MIGLSIDEIFKCIGDLHTRNVQNFDLLGSDWLIFFRVFPDWLFKFTMFKRIFWLFLVLLESYNLSGRELQYEIDILAIQYTEYDFE